MEVTDDVHWAEVYGRNGTITSYSMGKRRLGKWRVENDELCVDLEEDSSGCYEIWLSGNKIQLRRDGSDSLPLEGVLQKPSARR